MAAMRTTGRDIAPTPKPRIPVKIGETPAGRIGVYARHPRAGLVRVAHVGPHAGQSVAQRFLGGPAQLGKVDNRPAWIEIGKSGPNKAAAAANAKLTQSLKTAKGSVRNDHDSAIERSAESKSSGLSPPLATRTNS